MIPFPRHAGVGRHPRLSLIGVVFVLAFSGRALASQPVYYEKPVQLSGTIVYEKFYGPPNFGEDPKTDAKVSVIELKLDSPVDVVPANPDGIWDLDSYQGVTRVGLIDLDYPALGLDKLAGRHVVLRGTLFEQQDALQFNKVLMIVKTVNGTSRFSVSRTSE